MFDRLKRITSRSSEDGLSLIEVLVAMLIFSMLVVGIGYSMISILQMTRDNQTRETATSLASAELDKVRAVGDPFAIGSDSHTQTVGTNTYTIKRTAAWVTPGGNIDTCGSSGGPLQYKSISVTVNWDGMMNGKSSVYSDTALVPASRINDPLKGTVLVSVKDSHGRGLAGVTFTAVSPGGSLVTTPTDSDGCSFILKVPPGKYKVTLTNSNYMDINQKPTPYDDKDVIAGQSAKYSYQYDKKATYQVKYASNDTTPGTTYLPTNMVTTFFNGSGRFYTSPSSPPPTSVDLYPAGYEIVAGKLIPATGVGQPQCGAVDPETWEPDTTKTPETVGTRADNSYAPPGGIADPVGVPMGIATVAGGSQQYLFAVSVSGLEIAGQPVCDAIMNYSFGKVLGSSASTKTKIALPFGTWRLFTSSTTTGTRTLIPLARITVTAPGAPVGTDGTFVLDPRGVTP